MILLPVTLRMIFFTVEILNLTMQEELHQNPSSAIMSRVKQWQQEGPAGDLGSLLDAGPGAVVTLVAGETELAVHRAVLAAGSPVFAATFAHDMQEASSGRVQIDDVDGSVLRQLVAFLYSGRAPQLPSMAPQLLAAADKYGMVALAMLCEKQLEEDLNVQNAAAAAVVAVRHSCARLKDSAVAFISKHSFEVMATQGWEDAILNYPKEVVEVSRLIGPSAAETRSSASSDSRQTQSDLGQTAATTVLPRGPGHPLQTTPPDEVAVSRFRSMSAREKERRLIQASNDGAIGELRALLAVGVDTEARDEVGWSALHRAADKGDEEAIRCLLQAGVQVNIRNNEQWTPLHCAALWGGGTVVRLLVAAGGDVSLRDVIGMTPLHCAALNGQAAAATALLAAGADRTARDRDGKTPLDMAVAWNKSKLVDILR